MGGGGGGLINQQEKGTARAFDLPAVVNSGSMESFQGDDSEWCQQAT